MNLSRNPVDFRATLYVAIVGYVFSPVSTAQVQPQPVWMTSPGGTPDGTTISYDALGFGGNVCNVCTTTNRPDCLELVGTSVSCGQSATHTFQAGHSVSMSLAVNCGSVTMSASGSYSFTRTSTYPITSGDCQRCALYACYPNVTITVRQCTLTTSTGVQVVTYSTTMRPSGNPTIMTICEEDREFCCDQAGVEQCCDSSPSVPGTEDPIPHPGGIEGSDIFDEVIVFDVTAYLSQRRSSIDSLHDLTLPELGILYLQIHESFTITPPHEVRGFSISCSGLMLVEVEDAEEILSAIEQSGADMIASGAYKDVNFDGVVDAQDLFDIGIAILGQQSDPTIVLSSDINGDGVVDIHDMMLILP